MLVYNTQLHKKVELEPIEPGKIRMYVCGPTVYDQIHVGNGRTFLAFDVIRRYLQYKGYQVTFAQNLTDVDDKIINRANEQGRTDSPRRSPPSSPTPSSSRCTAWASSTPTSARAPRARYPR